MTFRPVPQIGPIKRQTFFSACTKRRKDRDFPNSINRMRDGVRALLGINDEEAVPASVLEVITPPEVGRRHG